MQKPTVHYTGTPMPFRNQMILRVLDHPSFPTNTEVTTSTVLSWDDKTGKIETKNTVYIPAE